MTTKEVPFLLLSDFLKDCTSKYNGEEKKENKSGFSRFQECGMRLNVWTGRNCGRKRQCAN
jgi:hypothetical protein